jgi:SET domain-containing protein
MAEKIIIKKSRIHGKGIFASKKINRGEIVFILKGRIVHWKVKDQKTSLYGPNWIGITKEKWLDVKSPGVYLNHSCNPNCGIKGKIQVVALKNIDEGEEITIDYSITEMDKLWYMNCKCGNKNCRKIIKSIQTLPKKIFNKYTPFIPTYFARVYNKINENK